MAVQNNDIRRLINSKADKISFQEGHPINSEGRNGDFTVRIIRGRGISLFLKASGRWYSIPIYSDFITRDDLDRIISKRPPKYSGELGFHQGAKEFELKQSANDSLKYAGSTTKINRDVNDGNPTFQVGSSDTENFKIEVNYESSGKGIDNVVLGTNTASGTANMGTIHLKVDGATRHTILEDAGMRLYGKTFTINDASDAGDLFKIETTTHGATTISTVDDDAAAAHLTLAADGAITLDAAAQIYIDMTDRCWFRNAGTEFGNIQVDTVSQFTLFEQGGASQNDYFQIGVATHGETTITTIDAAATAAHLTLAPDGEIFLDAKPAVNSYNSGIRLKSQGTEYGALTVHHSLSCLTLYEAGGTSNEDYFAIEVGAAGATALKTHDVAGADANLTLNPDGHLRFKTGDGDVDSVEYVIGSNTYAAFSAEDGSYSQLKMYENGGESSNDYFNISVAEHGETTLTTVDAAAAAANLTMTIDGDILLDSADEIVIDHTNRFKFKKAGTEYAKFDVDGSSQLTMFEQGGATTDDYLLVNVATNGATTLQTVDAAGADADLTLDADGDITLDAASGNIYVKDNGGNYTPGSDYEIATKKYVDDNAGGGGGDYYIHNSARARTQYNNWYYGAQVMYGFNYYYWTSSTGTTSTPTAYWDSFCPGYIIPKNGTVKAYTIIGNISTTDTWEWMLMKGAQPTYGSAGNYTLSQVGSTQSAGGSANILYKWEETGLSVAVNAGDMILPYFRRTTDNDASYSYAEVSMVITLG